MTPFRAISYRSPVLRRTLVVALLVALPLLSSCSSDDGDDGPSASISTTTSRPSTTSTSVARTPEEEVEAAYLRSWDVYAKAVRELDPSGLEESYTGDALDLVREEVEERSNDGRRSRVEVDHDYQITLIDESTAGVFDTYRNHSVLVDNSGEPVEADPNEVITEIYTMRRVDGGWKVARITRR